MAVTELWLVRHGESIANKAASAAEEAGSDVVEIGMRDTDVPLSEDGERQAAALGAYLRDNDARLRADGTRVWVSSYRRARQTLAIALEAADLPLHATVDERLRDRELGILDLLTHTGVRNRHPEEDERRAWLGKFSYRPPGGESWADLALRLRSVLRDIEEDRRPAANPTADAAGRSFATSATSATSAAATPPSSAATHADTPTAPDAEGDLALIVAHDSIVMLLLYVCLGWEESELLEFAAGHAVKNASVTRLRRADASSPWTLEAFADTTHIERSGAPVTHHSGDRDDARSEGSPENAAVPS